MVKSAGFLKRLKKIKDFIGKGASWVNNNIVKPLNPIIDEALDFVPYGNVIKNVKNKAGEYLDQRYGTQQDNRITNIVRKGGDCLLDTQRLPSEPKVYSNPFGARLN